MTAVAVEETAFDETAFLDAECTFCVPLAVRDFVCPSPVLFSSFHQQRHRLDAAVLLGVAAKHDLSWSLLLLLCASGCCLALRPFSICL